MLPKHKSDAKRLDDKYNVAIICAVNQHVDLSLQIAQVLTRAFIYFIEEFGGWAKELIKLLDEYGVSICNVFFVLAYLIAKQNTL